MSESIYDKYEMVIELQAQALFLANTKAYASASFEYGAMPDTLVSPHTLGLPSMLLDEKIKISKGKANPKTANELLHKVLDKQA
jgi:Asp-tRNA(Asn)/Glu-tRNA(Gln) amidotransferase B subunit